MQKSFQEMVERIVEQDPRYDKEAYDFIKEALEFTIKQQIRGQAERDATTRNARDPGRKIRAGQRSNLAGFGAALRGGGKRSSLVSNRKHSRAGMARRRSYAFT